MEECVEYRDTAVRAQEGELKCGYRPWGLELKTLFLQQKWNSANRFPQPAFPAGFQVILTPSDRDPPPITLAKLQAIVTAKMASTEQNYFACMDCDAAYAAGLILVRKSPVGHYCELASFVV